jgi:hypothetical protein
MSIQKKIFFMSLFLASFNLFAVPYDMILVGDPVIEDIRFLSLESGKSVPSFTPPFAPHEIKNFISLIDEDSLSVPAKEAYKRIRNRLDPKTPLSLTWDVFSLSLNVDLTFEGRLRTNTDMDWYPVQPKIPSFLSVPLKLNFLDVLQLYVDPAVSIDPYDYKTDEYFSNNLVFFFNNDINGNSPLKTFIAAGGSWWNFQLGRDRLSFGPGISGNLSIADNPPYYEFMRLSFFSNQFKYSLIVNQTPLKISKELYPALDENPDYLTMTTQRYFYLSRVDITLFKVLTLSLMEGVMAGNSALELRYLNPLMIFHNAMTWRDYQNWDAPYPNSNNPDNEYQGHMNGSFFSAEFNWHIIKSLSAYGQFAMTELSIGPELDEGRTEAPNAIGLMFGLQYSHSFNKWASVFYLECIYTSPFLYINPTPFASIIFMHDVQFVHENHYYYYFGYPRDTFALTAGTRFFNNDKLIINGEFSWIARGEYGKFPIEWNWTKDHSWAPSGTPENNFILSVGAQWRLFSFLTLKGKLTGIYSLNYNNISGNNEAGGQVSLCANFHY